MSKKPEMLAVLGFVLLAGIFLFSMNGLKESQRDGYRHSIDVLAVNDGIDMGAELNRFSLEAVGNRDPREIEKDWGETKLRSLEIVANLQAAADEEDDKKRMAEADLALREFIDLYERRMLPLLNADASRSERDAIKLRLDEQTRRLTDLMCDHMVELHKKIRESELAYEWRFDVMVWLAIGLLSLSVALIFKEIRDSRAMTPFLNPELVARQPKVGISGRKPFASSDERKVFQNRDDRGNP